MGAVVGDPAVVGIEGRLLEIEVVDVAEHHADRRVDDLGGDAVAVLLGESSSRVPASPVELFEAGALGADLGGILAGGGDQAHGDRHGGALHDEHVARSEEHTSELQSLMRISYAVFCLKKKKKEIKHKTN